jgi:hypothetical protein
MEQQNIIIIFYHEDNFVRISKAPVPHCTIRPATKRDDGDFNSSCSP